MVLSGLFVPVCLCPAFLPVLGVLCESGFFFVCFVMSFLLKLL